MPHRSARLVWTGRAGFAVIVVGLVAYLVAVGLDKADKVASGVSMVVALIALGAPYLLPPTGPTVPAAPEPGSGPGPAQLNQASGQGRVYGVQGGDMIIGDDGR
jgi:hypothetical protein